MTWKWEPMGESSLGSIDWPSVDPRSVDQPTRCRTARDETLCAQVIVDAWKSFDPVRHRKDTRSSSSADCVASLLASSRLNFNCPGRVRSDQGLLSAVQGAVRENLPVQVIYPLFANILSWPKQHVNTGPSAAEETCLRQFAAIDRASRLFHPPGIRFTVLCDATLYSQGYLDNPLPLCTNYRKSLKDMAARLAPNVEILDYAEELGMFSATFEREYYNALRVAECNLSELAPGVDLGGLFQSLRASLNNRGLEMTYLDYYETFGPKRNVLNKYHRLFDEKAARALPRKLALRHVVHKFEPELRESRFPGAIRATCHIHRGERPVLGIRPYPDFQRTSKLLPYHGVPLIWREGERFRLAVYAELQLRGRSDLVRVVDSSGQTYLYEKAA